MAYTVYMHTSPSGKRYVGITGGDPKERWANGNGYTSQFFRRAINKYGWHNIHHEILLTGLTKEEASDRERYFIALFRTQDNRFGYNIEPGGMVGNELSDATKDKIRSSLMGHEVSEEARKKIGDSCSKAIINLDTGEVFKSLTAAGKCYGTTKSKIGDCVKGRTKTCVGYHWGYAEDYKGVCIERKEAEPITRSAIRREQVRNIVNLDTGEVFSCAIEASEAYGISRECICRCARGESKTSGGYHWAFADDETAVMRYKLIPEERKAKSYRRRSRKVINLDTFEVFETQQQAARSCGKCDSYKISQCCTGRRGVAFGYHWAYADDEAAIARFSLMSDEEKMVGKKRKVANLDTLEVFESISDAARRYGINGSDLITRCCKGRCKTAGGYHWAYAEKSQ